ncbi:hypothetical protein GCM10022261_14570 [Brevibacterium daeguense]|uniref:Spermidine/putrescine transport system substrate-binding protein n=1 Tax=Brevibacterium daeguense TaxID=909936 RepID=A0ABP8EIZ1_9MICO|nr:spermidine/putrescine ABC transporter substrate-binding protein [Brevibacterium daeguense]
MAPTRPLPADPMLSSLVRAQVDRRRVLAAAGGLGLAGLLAACGTGGMTTEEGMAPAEDVSEQEKMLRWANWTLYLDYDDKTGTYPTLEKFTDQTGIDVNYSEDIDSNESYYGKVQAQLSRGQSIGQDIITLTDWMASRMVADGWLQELNHDNIPNIANLLPELQNVQYDPGRKYSVTWQSGFTGLAWNKEAVPQGLKNVSDLWNPDLRGRVEIIDGWNETPALVMLEQGVDITRFTEDDYANAVDIIAENVQNGQIRQAKGNSYKEDLISGDAVAVVAWSGDITQLNTENGDKWDFTIPEAGGDLWSDNSWCRWRPPTRPMPKR